MCYHKNMSVKVVVDTNVFLGALLSREGANRAFLRLCFKGVYQPLMGTSLFCEHEDVLARISHKQISR
ncbi:MAG: PIN domain-containing protein [Candidatus Sericytochromatia bacterium]|nr:PIN domain-containing protein [Candidatus Sericytochromatia bacterium]